MTIKIEVVALPIGHFPYNPFDEECLEYCFDYEWEGGHVHEAKLVTMNNGDKSIFVWLLLDDETDQVQWFFRDGRPPALDKRVAELVICTMYDDVLQPEDVVWEWK